MNIRSISVLCLLSLVAVACGSSDPVSEPAGSAGAPTTPETPPTSSESTTTAPPAETESLAEQLSRTAATPADDSESAPRLDPDVGAFELSPSNPQPGEMFEATFEPDNERGGYFTLEQWSGSEWLPAVFGLESGTNGGSPTWVSLDGDFEMLDYGVAGAGPDLFVMPDVIDPGIWRLCTANAFDEVCSQLTVNR